MTSISRTDLNNNSACPSQWPRSNHQQWCSWGSWSSNGETVMLC